MTAPRIGSVARVPRPVLLRLVVALGTGLLGLPLLTALPAAAAPEQAAPLEVTIESLSPASLPARGRITLSGRVTNRSEDTWTGLKAYLFTSETPIRDAAELAEQAATDPATEVGARLTGPGLYDEVPDLAPGESRPFQLSVRRRDLQISGEPGVYWIGAHVLGAVDGVREDGADGRARTFIPLMTGRSPSTRLTLVLPLDAPVLRSPNGQVARTARWHRLLGPDGRLDRLLDISAQTAHQSFTWLVDPALLQAVHDLARGNPGLDITPTDEEPTPSPSAAPTDGTTPPPTPDVTPSGASEDETDEEELSPAEAELARYATEWLAEFRRQADQHDLMATPYGDLDVAAAADAGRWGLYRTASRLGADTLARLDIDATEVVGPPAGYLPRAALERIEPATPIVLRQEAMPKATHSVVRTENGATAVLTDGAAASGGPGPEPRLGALAFRQRLLAEAALHALSPERDQPLVVRTRQDWDPGPDWRLADFFAGLDQPWLTMSDLTTIRLTEAATPGGPAAYPPRERRAQVPVANLAASRSVVVVGQVFATLLTRNDTIDAQLARNGILASSLDARADPATALSLARRTRSRVIGQMRRVELEGPSFATMSSGEGPIQVTLVNGLDEPVTVGVEARTSSPDLKVVAPDPITLGPGQRAAVRLKATASGVGVHTITLVAVDADGAPIGTVTRFSIRTSQVGLVIWVVMGIAGAVLLVAVGFRVARRVGTRKRTHGPLLEEGS
jgi:hypothetical protein